jgi:hypothetical protein
METIYPIIRKAKYMNQDKTKIQVLLENENGTTNLAEFQIRKDALEGENVLWDRIKKEYDMSLMDSDLEDSIRRFNLQREYEDKRKKAALESEKMKMLFDAKLNFFNFPLIDELSDEEKATIRRAPDLQMLQVAIVWVLINYATRNNKSMLDVFDAMEDAIFTKGTQ